MDYLQADLDDGLSYSLSYLDQPLARGRDTVSLPNSKQPLQDDLLPAPLSPNEFGSDNDYLFVVPERNSGPEVYAWVRNYLIPGAGNFRNLQGAFSEHAHARMNPGHLDLITSQAEALPTATLDPYAALMNNQDLLLTADYYNYGDMTVYSQNVSASDVPNIHEDPIFAQDVSPVTGFSGVAPRETVGYFNLDFDILNEKGNTGNYEEIERDCSDKDAEGDTDDDDDEPGPSTQPHEEDEARNVSPPRPTLPLDNDPAHRIDDLVDLSPLSSPESSPVIIIPPLPVLERPALGTLSNTVNQPAIPAASVSKPQENHSLSLTHSPTNPPPSSNPRKRKASPFEDSDKENGAEDDDREDSYGRPSWKAREDAIKSGHFWLPIGDIERYYVKKEGGKLTALYDVFTARCPGGGSLRKVYACRQNNQESGTQCNHVSWGASAQGDIVRHAMSAVHLSHHYFCPRCRRSGQGGDGAESARRSHGKKFTRKDALKRHLKSEKGHALSERTAEGIAIRQEKAVKDAFINKFAKKVFSED